MDVKLPEINVGIDKERPITTQQNEQSNGSHEQPIQQNTKVLPKPENGSAYLDIPLQSSFRPSLDTISNVSLYSADNDNERSSRLSLRSDFHNRIPSRSPAPPRTWRGRWEVFWQGNKGFLLVLIAEFFGAFMTAATRLLETDESHGERMHPFQILFVRMGITAILSMVYMWWAKVPYAPLGMKEVRPLLVLRGFGGLFGVMGLYYSLIYLPLGEATVITFLSPILTCYACAILLKEPFTRMEQLAACVSLFGVVLIAQPVSLFSYNSSSVSLPSGDLVPPSAANNTTTAPFPAGPPDATPAQRLGAVGIALVGVCGATCAYTTIRWIGKRAHPLIAVNYYSLWCTIVSVVAMVAVPGVTFRLPATVREWTFLTFLGFTGFVFQFLLTAGLAHEKGSRATNTVYTGMLFALALDKIVWDITPGMWSLLGSSLILGSAIYVAVRTKSAKRKKAVAGGAIEEAGLMAGDELHDSDEENTRGSLPGVQQVQLRTIRV